MTVIPLSDVSVWVPDACTLPPAEQPLRVAEFDALFADALVEVRRCVARGTRATLLLEGPSDLASHVQRLVETESGCCSFFAFETVELAHPDPVRCFVELTVSVPLAHSSVFDGLVSRAVAIGRGAQ
ncbi:hypothetical protein [Aeromicrobium sp. Sec7.5]|uniref:hypothetical protein n=1 Tax=Aeromicrobium sp. Sec7.5 TaxID=3121276 RepID=UPI002FE468C6